MLRCPLSNERDESQMATLSRCRKSTLEWVYGVQPWKRVVLSRGRTRMALDTAIYYGQHVRTYWIGLPIGVEGLKPFSSLVTVDWLARVARNLTLLVSL